ncbi:uncharacterized protein MONOS_8212 [Monocercomonoides exilis]|uniref:uncharacterized protein n=1 Tax=Monocercomonoides exilis TaxID=2049356 RepID=UPI003559724F|nr:hypothetical protein MONOS_8212 [Monocercomonoides exilis]|eukprot:MONOS_8212.1-p1 / transcript=MONOS_8212.1 / gene=MONOS_8212 / organism=Monocercomonoides_exilis_PA203 / gene_product=unspecified product / transcript_product=unspecified product / location=Mono_scaffold00303:51151-52593(+) / protein_length=440 / sequence_SO=supercontig / SO=protein_coding / is_pseudo=false
MYDEEKSNDGAQKQSLANKFSKLFSELEDCDKNEYKQKIEEIIALMEEMDEEELYSTFTKEIFNKMDEMIEEEKLSMENALFLLIHIGRFISLKDIWNDGFRNSLLKARFEKMVAEEDEKKEGNDEKLIADLGECMLLFGGSTSMEFDSVCVPYLLKVALNKEENEETQKEVETALMALSCINICYKVEKDLYLNEIKEIIQYHEKHHNLTRLAYQSAWGFLIILSLNDQKTIEVIVDELHFEREAARELDELMQSVDWKKKEEEEVKEKGKNEELVLKRWLQNFDNFFVPCGALNKECSGIVESIVGVLRVSRDNHSEIGKRCILSFEAAAEERAVKVDALLKSGAVDAVLEGIQQPTLKHYYMWNCLIFFKDASMLLDEIGGEMEDAKRKELKREMFEKMEEEGYEDIVIWLYHYICPSIFGDFRLVENFPDYFVYL